MIRDLSVHAYEILFRSGLEGCFPEVDGNHATTSVITSSFLDVGLDALTGGKRVFINFTEDLLTKEVPMLFPADQLVVEVLESVPPTEAVLAACRRLKQAGYTLALDDVTTISPWLERSDLRELVSIAKIDFVRTDAAQRFALARKLRGAGIELLAEKVEKIEDFAHAAELECKYFQGFFFHVPSVHSSKSVPSGRMIHLRLVKELHADPIDFKRLEELVKLDVSLSFRLLRFINSAAFGFRSRIESIHHALVLLGEREVRRWVTLVAMSGMLAERPVELLVCAVIRGRLCESLAKLHRRDAIDLDLFLLGMFSMLGAILEQPLEEALQGIPIDERIRAALLSGEGPLAELLQLAIAYEKGEWERTSALAGHLGVAESQLPRLYADAVVWSSQAFSS